MQLFLNFNGKLLPANSLLISPDNRSFRYGEGLFETIRFQNGEIPLWNYHWNRLSSSLPQLHFEVPLHFTESVLKQAITALVQKNRCTEAARIRITFFKGEGGLWEPPSTPFNYLIQCWPLERKDVFLNENGLIAGVFESSRKICDPYSNLKSGNYQLYLLAAQFAKQQKWNEALVLNEHRRICDATIANVFIVKQNRVITPQQSEGCVSGVMCSYLLETATKQGLDLVQSTVTTEELLQADEVFLTNAMGIRWVKEIGDKNFKNNTAAFLFHSVIKPLFS